MASHIKSVCTKASCNKADKPQKHKKRAQGGFSVYSPRLTKYLSTTEHEEWQVIDAMHLSTQSFDF